MEALRPALDRWPEAPMNPGAYWRRLAPRLRGFGITRVADITGLDHVGLPVAQAVRPRARSNAVTQGKGLSLEAAAVGAALECLEMAAGEALDGLAAATGDWQAWRHLAGGDDWPDDKTAFLAAIDLADGGLGGVPRDLISTDFSQGAPAQAAPILRHSIGLGAGPSFEWALFHGLLECIEADARIRGEGGGASRRVPVDADNPTYGPHLALVAAAGLRATIRALTTAHPAITAVAASVMEAPGATALPLPAAGYAARPDPDAAIAAALSEALQARLAVISGAREDITQRFYRHGASADALQAAWDDHAPATAGERLTGAATDLTVRDLARGLGRVLAVPLFWDAAIPLAIVRVVSPDLVADPQVAA